MEPMANQGKKIDSTAAENSELEEIISNFSAGQSPMSRREFLRLAGMGAAVVGVTATGALSLAAPAVGALGSTKSLPKSTVLIIKHPKISLEGYKADPAVLSKMISVGMKKLTAVDSVEGAWRKLFKSSDKVCMKRNRLSSESIWTHRELDEVISDALVKHVKIDRKTVVVWDPKPKGELGEWSKPFYTKKNKIETRIVRALSDYGTALINLPILKTHTGTGLTIALKNHLGTVNNAGEFHKPGEWGGDLGPNIADLNLHPAIKDKTRLIVVDAIRPLYNAGPGENPRYRWDYNGLIMGSDPVAVDTVGLAILEAKRQREQMANWKLGPGRKCLAYAEKLGLGNHQGPNIRILQIDLGSDDPKPVVLPLEKVA